MTKVSKESKEIKTLLAADLSLNLPAFAVLKIEGSKVSILDLRYCNNKPFASKPHSERIHRIAEVTRSIMKDYPDVDTVVRERGFSRHTATTQSLFKVVGVNDLLTYEQLGIPQVHEIPPTTVKKIITGDGKASKELVDFGLRRYLVEEQKEVTFATDDCSDAVAVGIAWLLK
ncbi:MAG: crossover junction endodeoxyribonuclease RuvC, partial [Erysipelotrichaceae bacterium]|nr:crossover junction endodeoxyribonuclease RuvC [Erysipelotrichaceae bacterium]